MGKMKWWKWFAAMLLMLAGGFMLVDFASRCGAYLVALGGGIIFYHSGVKYGKRYILTGREGK